MSNYPDGLIDFGMPGKNTCRVFKSQTNKKQMAFMFFGPRVGNKGIVYADNADIADLIKFLHNAYRDMNDE